MTRTELTELAAWAEVRLPRLIDEACAATVEHIPFYRDGKIVTAGELRRSVDHNLRFLVTAIGHPHAPLDLGAPLPEVLHCYRGTAELAAAAYALRLNSATELWHRQHPPTFNGRAKPAGDPAPRP